MAIRNSEFTPSNEPLSQGPSWGLSGPLRVPGVDSAAGFGFDLVSNLFQFDFCCLLRPLSGSSPAKIRPGRPIYGPEALLRNIEYPWEGLGGILVVVLMICDGFVWFVGVLFGPIRFLLALIGPYCIT